MFQLIKIEFKLLLGEREDEKTFPGNVADMFTGPTNDGNVYLNGFHDME